jgi:hypothetical protein
MEPTLKATLKDIDFFQLNEMLANKTCLILISHNNKSFYFRINKGSIDYVNVPSEYFIKKFEEVPHQENIDHQSIIAKTFLEEKLSESYNSGNLVSFKFENFINIQSNQWYKLEPPIDLNGLSGINFYNLITHPKIKGIEVTEKDISNLFSDYASTNA